MRPTKDPSSPPIHEGSMDQRRCAYAHDDLEAGRMHPGVSEWLARKPLGEHARVYRRPERKAMARRSPPRPALATTSSRPRTHTCPGLPPNARSTSHRSGALTWAILVDKCPARTCRQPPDRCSARCACVSSHTRTRASAPRRPPSPKGWFWIHTLLLLLAIARRSPVLYVGDPEAPLKKT